jgi:hypothetical protein
VQIVRQSTPLLDQAEWKNVGHVPLSPLVSFLIFYLFTARQPTAVEDDEEAQLKELQAALAM